MKSQSLIFQTDVEQTLICELVRTGEAPDTEAVVDRNTNDRLTDLDRLLYDKREVVTLIRSSAYEEKSANMPQK